MPPSTSLLTLVRPVPSEGSFLGCSSGKGIENLFSLPFLKYKQPTYKCQGKSHTLWSGTDGHGGFHITEGAETVKTKGIRGKRRKISNHMTRSTCQNVMLMRLFKASVNSSVVDKNLAATPSCEDSSPWLSKEAQVSHSSPSTQRGMPPSIPYTTSLQKLAPHLRNSWHTGSCTSPLPLALWSPEVRSQAYALLSSQSLR